MKSFPNTPLVSIVVPMYGVENYIARCAKSLFAQTYPAIEFIFVDDGCQDRTVEVLRGVLQAQDPALQARTRIISKENEGLPLARKACLDAATGEYVLHVDADDWIDPETVEKLVRKALETDADMVVFDFWKECANRSKPRGEKESSIADADLFRRRLYLYGSYGYLWEKFCRRSLFDDLYFPTQAMYDDVVMSTQLLYNARKIVHLREHLYHYDQTNTGSTTRKPKASRDADTARNLLDMYLHYQGQSPSPIEDVQDIILLRAAWIAFSEERKLFAEYPFLADAARALPYLRTAHPDIFKQWKLKRFLRSFR